MTFRFSPGHVHDKHLGHTFSKLFASMLSSWIKAANWQLLITSLLLIIASTLLIVNANCSKPHGVSAEAPVCVGGHLSIQTWLVIVSLEFGFLGLYFLPKLIDVLISKLITRNLTRDGMSFASLLNSQRSAPLMTQMRFGMKRAIGIRMLGILIAVVIGILYKYSFVRVQRYSTFAVDDTHTPVVVGCNGRGCKDGISNNMVDALSGSTALSSSNISFSPRSPFRAKQHTQIYGPSEPAFVPQLQSGTQFLCTPTYYSRSRIVSSDAYWSPPKVSNDPYNNGVRFFDTEGGTLVDVYSANGTLQILSAKYAPNTTICYDYDSKMTAMVSACVGYTSWLVNNTFAPEALLQDPVDIDCYQEKFELIPWANSPGAQFTLNLLQGLGSKNINNLPLSTSTMNVILASMNHSDAVNILEGRLNASLLTRPVNAAMPAECSSSSSTSAEKPWVVSGISYNDGTGMTLLGVVLQGFVLLICLLALLVLFWPTPALLTEWPAQWLVLAKGMNQAKLQEAVQHTSFGKNEVDGELWITMTTQKDKTTGRSPDRNSLIFDAEEIETKRFSYERGTEGGLRTAQGERNGPGTLD